jgi:hypothetical protein
LGEKLKDPKRIDLDVLDARLTEVNRRSKIEHIDLYGGEIFILPDDYIQNLISVIKKHYEGSINIITNLTKMKRWLIERDDIDLSVSFDFEARSAYQTTLNNLMTLQKPVSILMLASPKLMSLDVQEMITILNNVPCIQTVEIKPYSSNQYNQLDTKFSDYENFVKRFIFASESGLLKPSLMNINYIQESLNKKRNSFSDNHIYITPSGRFGVLEFDGQDNEFFLEMDTLDHYFDWEKKEKQRVNSNQFCSACPWRGHCLTEHYRYVRDLTYSCNGFKHLLEWYQNEGT